MVMLHHYSQYVISQNISNSLIYQLFSTQGGYLGVAIFFFLSGYGLMESEKKRHLKLESFIKNRILKTYIPVFAVTLIWFFIASLILPNSPIEMGRDYILIIKDILWGFGDEVLWFIKVILFLYSGFYIFSIIRLKSKRYSLVFLCLFTVGFTFLTAVMLAPFLCISIPYFTIGIGMSLALNNYKHTLFVSLGILLLICFFSLMFLSKSLGIHSIINACVIGSLILLFSVVKIDFKIPVFLGVISFDLYLVHNKILMSLKSNADTFDILLFISLTIFFTTVFYLLRTKLLKI